MAEWGLTGRYVIRITPADIGSRVSVRTRSGEDVDGPRYTDTLGTLDAWEDGVLTITRRDGSRRQLLEASMVAGKVIPPPPPRRH